MAAQWQQAHKTPNMVTWECRGEEERGDANVWIERQGDRMYLFAAAGRANDLEAAMDPDTAEAIGQELIRMARELKRPSERAES